MNNREKEIVKTQQVDVIKLMNLRKRNALDGDKELVWKHQHDILVKSLQWKLKDSRKVNRRLNKTICLFKKDATGKLYYADQLNIMSYHLHWLLEELKEVQELEKKLKETESGSTE